MHIDTKFFSLFALATCISVKKATILEFSAEEESKFRTRYENGYDIPDQRYIQWLQKHHPSSAQRLSSKRKDGMWMGVVHCRYFG